MGDHCQEAQKKLHIKTSPLIFQQTKLFHLLFVFFYETIRTYFKFSFLKLKSFVKSNLHLKEHNHCLQVHSKAVSGLHAEQYNSIFLPNYN